MRLLPPLQAEFAAGAARVGLEAASGARGAGDTRRAASIFACGTLPTDFCSATWRKFAWLAAVAIHRAMAPFQRVESPRRTGCILCCRCRGATHPVTNRCRCAVDVARCARSSGAPSRRAPDAERVAGEPLVLPCRAHEAGARSGHVAEVPLRARPATLVGKRAAACSRRGGVGEDGGVG